jgi:hypothetical protein
VPVFTDVLKLLAAIAALATALITLNKTGVVDVPLVNEVPAFQNSPAPDVDFPPPSTKVAVPDVRGLTVEEAQQQIEDRGLVVRSISSIAVELCDYGEGMVESSLPPEGWEVGEGEGVTLYVCG